MMIHLRLLKNESAQGLVEYSLIMSLVVIGVIVATIIFGESVFSLYETIKNDVINAL